MTGQDVFTHLAQETEAVDRLVAGLDDEQLGLPTPAEGWTIRHQIGHLSFIFRLAGTAASDPEAFAAMKAGAEDDFDAAVGAALRPYLAESDEGLLARWRTESTDAVKALSAVDEPMVPWLVRPLPPQVLACAGMMELFGHGQDIADALGVEREYTDQIKWLCGFIAQVWDFGYLARGENPPDVAFRYELTAPSGDEWEFGPEDATQKIAGPAVDLCLVATRRRHRADTRLKAYGTDADRWLDIAQAYRGSPGPGRQPGQFA